MQENVKMTRRGPYFALTYAPPPQLMEFIFTPVGFSWLDLTNSLKFKPGLPVSLWIAISVS